MKHVTTILFAFLTVSLAALAGAAPASAVSGSAVSASAGTGRTGLSPLTPHYEVVRLALVGDTLEGVPTAARELRRALEELAAKPTAERAGVAVAKLDEVKALLPEAIAAAAELEQATTLAAARDALYELTKPLVRWREAAGEGPTVAYCSMAKRSWLQAPDAELGNPYYGRQMAGCGEVVSR